MTAPGRGRGPSPRASAPGAGAAGDAPRIAALIPALDEEEALPGVLEALEPLVDRVVVVDNGSVDRTVEVARAGGARVVREGRRGYGAACLAGIAALEGELADDDVVVFVDADQWVEADAFRRVTGPVTRGEADLVIGARTDPGGGVGTLMPHARLGNRLVLGLAGLLFGRRWRDLGPFRAIRLDALRALSMDDRSWGWTLQMQIRAERAGLEVREVEVPHRSRTEGESKITGSLSTSLRVGAKMFYTLARERLRGAP